MGNTKSKKKPKMDTVIAVAVIGLVGTIATALLNSSVITSWLNKPSVVTPASTDVLSENSMPTSAELFFGPLDGQLQHEPDGSIAWRRAEVSLENFIVEATFVNPYSASDYPWIMLLFFRDGYRVWVKSENEWGLGFWLNSVWTDGSDGQLPNKVSLLKNNGESNHLRLIASENLGCLYVNNMFVSEFSLSGLVQPGDIAVGVGEPEYTLPGKVTEFKGFRVYTISEISECPK